MEDCLDKENDSRQAPTILQSKPTGVKKQRSKHKVLSQPVQCGNNKQAVIKSGTKSGSQNLPNAAQPRQKRKAGHITKEEKDFKKLIFELAYAGSVEVVKKLSDMNDLFSAMVRSKLLDLNEYHLVLKIVAKVCKSDCEMNKLKIINQFCNPDFLNQFPIMLASAFSEDKSELGCQMAEDILRFFCSLVRMLPTRAADQIPTAQICYFLLLEIGGEKQGLVSPELLHEYETVTKAMEALKSLTALQPNWLDHRQKGVGEEPPGDFRELSIYPNYEDVICAKPPFLRHNIVTGPYRDVEHYLDIQFRLLREDFVRSLRIGVQDILQDPGTTKYRASSSSIRIQKGVKFEKYIREVNKETGRVINEGSLLCLKDRLSYHDWKTSKRFMCGALLCFTKDHFSTLLFAVVSCRDGTYTKKNQILVKFHELPEENIYDRDVAYTMVECGVFFEPYFQVMKALKSLHKENFPFIKYIIELQREDEPPKYLLDQNDHEGSGTHFAKARREMPVRITALGTEKALHEFVVLNESTWPTAKQLGLDNSQYQALKAALTRELAVIQGPPGTGKTFMALKIAEILICNKRALDRHAPILVVCLTNHALDQFLVGMLQFTNALVRVGGQSRCEALARYNMRNMKVRFSDELYDMQSTLTSLHHELMSLENTIGHLQTAARVPGVCISLSGKMVPRILEEYVEMLIEPPKGTKDLFFVSFNDIEKSIESWRLLAFGEIEMNLSNNCSEENSEKVLAESEKDYFKWLAKLEKKRVDESCHYFRSVVQSLREEMKTTKSWMISKKGEKLSNLWKKGRKLDYPDLLCAYNYMVGTLLDLPEKRKKLMAEAAKQKMILEENRSVEKLQALRSKDVIGLTTNGAARLHSSLSVLGCETVIVEEAAEVMESHIIASVSSKCQHLILIGDHKQLRPKISEYALEKYKFDVSLFERMVVNRESCVTLQVQHRMAPEMSNLIVPTIYKTLENHESVHHLPELRSLTKRLFFVTHSKPEKRERESTSKTNPHEAKYLIALCDHLLRQGYTPDQITLLTMYNGQMCLMKEIIRNKSGDKLKSVKVTVVDDFQGEESEIILLSLVRSNPEGRIGFLATENRVCVALSRAKHGCVIIGNMEILSANSKVWKAVRQSLEEQDALVSALTFRCETHPEHAFSAENPEDFEKFAPHGGCTTLCNDQLPCGHNCNRVCHVETPHDKIKCHEPCTRLCDAGTHKCKLLCYIECGSNCKVIVTKDLLCHHQASMACGADAESFSCQQIVTKTIPSCQHEVDVACSSEACPLPCEAQVPCGHYCVRKCHTDADPDHLEYQCRKPCEKIGKNCRMNHACQNLCFEECGLCRIKVKSTKSCGHTYELECHVNPEAVLCNKMCTKELECGHMCRRKCIASCTPCTEPVVKEIECGHTAKVACGRSASKADCTQQCEKLLACGHKCKARCVEECTVNCREVVGMSVGDCGHEIKRFCFEETRGIKVDVMRCTAKCRKMLICGHVCGGSCRGCHQGRFHEPCRKPCGRDLVCGHRCNKDCSEPCNSCNQKRRVTCDHTTREISCATKSTVCQLDSKTKCPHAKKYSCGTVKESLLCKKPCAKKLPCKHQCFGFCGAQCPELCWHCDREHLLKSFPKNAKIPRQPRFIVLPDCQHTIEVECLLAWFKWQSSNVEIKTCPLCTTPVSARIEIFKKMIWEPLEDFVRIKESSQINVKEITPLLLDKIKLLNKDKVQLRSVKDLILQLKSIFESELRGNSNKGRIFNFHFAMEIPAHSFKIEVLQLLVNILCGKSDHELEKVAQEVNFLIQRLKKTSVVWKQQIADFEALLVHLCESLGFEFTGELRIKLSEPKSLLKLHWQKCFKCKYLQFREKGATPNCKKCAKPFDVKPIEFEKNTF
ncbi:NFX1-type zinc finger-containing protein 1-like [Cloeon dipterum]|uniref:NFX1-type zinc finger-containing protein 1-like n=1 Tax=Cloeon dipterum TaxID=197152 RepID=UPI0032201494